MRVAHVDDGRGPQLRRSFAVRPELYPSRVGHGMLKWNGVPFEARRAHVHPVGPRSKTLARDDPGLGLDFDGADREFAAQPIRDATYAVAASASECAIVVIDEHVGRRGRRLWITQDHHLIVAEARRAIDRARVFRRRAGARTPHVEQENDVAGPVHARDRAARERMAGDQAPSLPLEFGRSPPYAVGPTCRW